jgi:hypothetical protein
MLTQDLPTRRLIFRLLVAAALVLLPAFPQEGHPLVGTWHGNWGTAPAARNDITVVLLFDGKTIGGMVNPGPDSFKIQNATLDPDGWKLHFEGDTKDAQGKPVHIAADGKIENISNVRRVITGTWTQGSSKGDFKITRDN